MNEKDWKVEALTKLGKAENVHPVVLAELLEQGYIVYADTPVEFELTAEGVAYAKYVQSADYASKRQ